MFIMDAKRRVRQWNTVFKTTYINRSREHCVWCTRTCERVGRILCENTFYVRNAYTHIACVRQRAQSSEHTRYKAYVADSRSQTTNWKIQNKRNTRAITTNCRHSTYCRARAHTHARARMLSQMKRENQNLFAALIWENSRISSKRKKKQCGCWLQFHLEKETRIVYFHAWNAIRNAIKNDVASCIRICSMKCSNCYVNLICRWYWYRYTPPTGSFSSTTIIVNYDDILRMQQTASKWECNLQCVHANRFYYFLFRVYFLSRSEHKFDIFARSNLKSEIKLNTKRLENSNSIQFRHSILQRHESTNPAQLMRQYWCAVATIFSVCFCSRTNEHKT